MQHNEDLTIRVINDLFEQLIAMKKAFKQALPDDMEVKACKRAYLRAFMLSGISNLSQIQRGLDRLLLEPSPWFPDPGTFLSLCKLEPQDIGAPTVQAAYAEACEKSHPCYGEKNWSHPAVRQAYHEVTPHTLRTESASKSRPLFEQAYNSALQELIEGKNMNRIENARQDTPENRSKYQEYFGEVKIKNAYSGANAPVLNYEDWLKSEFAV
jgi:hypothetical protein